MTICQRNAPAVVLLAIWGGITYFKWVDPALVPAPIDVFHSTWQLCIHDQLIKHLAVTARRVVVALSFAGSIGIPIGLAFGCRPRLYRWFEDTLHGLRSVPATCLFPLLLIVIGVGETSIIVLAAYPCLLIFLVNSASGATLTDRSRLHQMASLGASSFQTVSQLIFFEALPHITSAMRTCVSYALVLVVAVEMFMGVGDVGIGREIFDLQSAFLIPETYGAIILTGTLGIILNFVVNRVERYALRWLPRLEEHQA